LNFINTDSVPAWPEDIYLASKEIQSNLDTGILSETEYKRYKSIGLKKRRNEFLTGRYLFHEMNTHIFGTNKQAELRKAEMGKPYAMLNGRHIHVSFSHSNRLVMCAVSSATDVGIDIERSKRPSSKQLLKRMLCPEEYQFIDEFEPMELWTIKEAAVKRAGVGLRLDLHKVKIMRREKELIIRFNNDKTFKVRSFKALDHTIAVVF